MRENKIVEYGLEDQAKKLKGENLPLKSIATKLNTMLDGTKKLSFMAVKRYFDTLEEKKVGKELQEGGNPALRVYDEFHTEMVNIKDDLYNKKNDIDELIDVVKEDMDINKLVKLLQVQKDYYNTIQKNVVSLIQYSENRFKPVVNQTYKMEVNIRNLLIDFSEKLCPKCRAKIIDIIGDL
jgi:hypothetical protein